MSPASVEKALKQGYLIVTVLWIVLATSIAYATYVEGRVVGWGEGWDEARCVLSNDGVFVGKTGTCHHKITGVVIPKQEMR